MFRIGIHVGNIMMQGDDLFGDAVNIAARLEALAEAGGICVSGAGAWSRRSSRQSAALRRSRLCGVNIGHVSTSTGRTRRTAIERREYDRGEFRHTINAEPRTAEWFRSDNL